MRGLLFTLLCAGCHNLSPPPIVMRHQGAQPDGPGDLRIQLLVGYSQGVLSVSPGYGFVLQSTYQTDERWKAGGSLALGFNGTDRARAERWQRVLWLVSGRAFGRYHYKDVDSIATEAGVGLGYTSNKTVYLTLDTGGTFGARHNFFTRDGDLYAYVAPSLAASIPLVRGRPTLISQAPLFGAHPHGTTPPPKPRYVRPTYFFSLSLGSLAEGAPSADSYGGSLELHGLFAHDGKNGSTSFGISGGPSVVVR